LSTNGLTPTSHARTPSPPAINERDALREVRRQIPVQQMGFAIHTNEPNVALNTSQPVRTTTKASMVKKNDVM
jgi:hypothetical protein